MDKTDILDLDQAALKEKMIDWQFPLYRSGQIYQWLWQKNVKTFDEMKNVPKDVRQKLDETYFISSLKEDLVQKSSDGTMKFRLELHDGFKIEAVLIPVSRDDRYTICVSSQVGCSLSCKFCATGTMERSRNLKAQEIIDQYTIVNRYCKKAFGRGLTNVVYMGMGEPLLNYKEVVRSIRLMTSPDVLGMSPRRITVSTAGIAKMITKLADEGMKINLALSLHAATDEKRNKIMEINESNNLDTLLDSIHYFYRELYTKVSYEYIALRDFNDSIEDAEQLVELCQGIPVMVNIIEYNTVALFDWQKTSEDQLNAFAKKLRDEDVMVTVRRSRGKDIDAACGQLAVESSGEDAAVAE